MADTPAQFAEYPKWVGDRKKGTRQVVNNKDEEQEFVKNNPPDDKKAPGWDKK